MTSQRLLLTITLTSTITFIVVSLLLLAPTNTYLVSPGTPQHAGEFLQPSNSTASFYIIPVNQHLNGMTARVFNTNTINANIISRIHAYFDDSIHVMPLSDYIDPKTTQEQLKAHEEQQTAISVNTVLHYALNYLNITYTITGDGFMVRTIGQDSCLEGSIIPDDIIASINDHTITTISGFQNYMNTTTQTQSTTVTYTRNRHNYTTIVYCASKLGITGTLHNPRIITANNITINLGNISGGSAGLPLVLQLISALNQTDLSAGKKIAATGALTPDGNIHPIAHADLKIHAARKAGMDYILIPQENYDTLQQEQALPANVIPVSNVTQAIATLERFNKMNKNNRQQ